MPTTRLVIFVIDAGDFRIAEAASLLFKNVLCDKYFLMGEMPLIVVCNKVLTNHKVVKQNVKSLLEAEITNLGKQYESEVGLDEGACVQRIFNDSDSFSFDGHDVTFLSGSVLEREFVHEVGSMII